MNKVICDICGTTYPETASQCPICGCAKPGDASAVSIDALNEEEVAAGSYAYVKGGRFSNSNVRKRNKAGAASKKKTEVTYEEDESQQEKSGRDRGLWIALILLLLAIAAVLLYMYFTLFAPAGKDDSGTENTGASSETSFSQPELSTPTDQSVSSSATGETDFSEPDGIMHCTALELSTGTIELDAVGNAWLLNVSTTPENTTDTVTFISSNEAVATVTAQGRVTAVGPGSAEITVTCGDIIAKCTVICDFAEPTEDVTEPTTDATEPSTDVSEPTTDATEPTEDAAEPSEPDPNSDDWGMNRSDISFRKPGEKWDLYKGTVSKKLITWYSQDKNVATIENGVVTAVGPGTTVVFGSYNGKKVSCVIRCRFPGEGEETPPSESTPDQEPAENVTYTINKKDVTIKKGETFALTLTDSTGTVVNVTWSAAEKGICTISGNSITGAGKGQTTVSATVGGKTYSCIIRVTG